LKPLKTAGGGRGHPKARQAVSRNLAMEPLGKFLKTERENRNRSLEEVERFTRIRKYALKAIEEDRYDLLPPVVYVKGYLFNYARYLGIDPKEVLQRFQASVTDCQPTRILESCKRTPFKKGSGQFHKISILLILGLIGAIVAFWLSGAFVNKVFIASLFPPPHPFALERDLPRPGFSKGDQGGEEKSERIDLEAPSLKVIDAAFGTEIGLEEGRLILKERSNRIEARNRRVYFLTKIEAQRGGKIAHVWFCQGKESYRMDIEVKPPGWSVYSYLTLGPGHVGYWKGEVREGDKVLASQNFEVVPPVD
jgi:hypothetical protein